MQKQPFFKRLILIFLFALLGTTHLVAQKNMLSTKISLDIENKSISYILSAISSKYGIKFTFNPDEIDDGQLHSINTVNTPLREILKDLLDATPYDFKEHGSQVVFFRNNLKKTSPVVTTQVKPDAEKGTSKKPDTQASEPIIKTIYQTDTLYIKDTVILHKTEIKHDTIVRVDTVFKERPKMKRSRPWKRSFKPTLIADNLTNKNNGISVGGYYEYIWGTPSYESDDAELSAMQKKAETDRIANFSAGITGEYNYKRFSFRVGLSYTKLGNIFDYDLIEKIGGYKVDTVDVLYTLGNPDTIWTYVTDSSWVYTDFERSYYNTNSYKYLEIPVHIKFDFLVSGNTKLYALAGVNFGFLIGANALRFDEQRNVVKTSAADYSKVSISYQMGLGVAVATSKNLSLFAEGAYKKQFSNMNPSTYPVEKRFEMVSGKAGILFKF